jgi:GAF domain-containing protein
VRNELQDVIREFTRNIINPYDVAELLHQLTMQAMSVVDADGAGIMLEDEHGQLRFAAASEERIVRAEEHQERIESGACHEAYSTNEVVVVDDLAETDRWPEYRDRVVGLGLEAVLGVPMIAFGRTVGVINIYRSSPTSWTEEDIEAARIIVTMAAGYIVNANQLRASQDVSDQLRLALESRDLIGQAKGILMARENIDADGAFDLLRKKSQETNRKLRDIAQLAVERYGSD